MLIVDRDDKSPEAPGFVRKLRDDGFQVELRKVNEARSFLQILETFRVTKDFSKFDLVVVTDYLLAFGLCLRKIVSRNRTQMAALSFNVSRRYLRTSIGPIDWAINYLFRQLLLIVVHSRAERELFSHVHNLDKQRIALAHWGFDLPQDFHNQPGVADKLDLSKQYVCMIGRNNRDFQTLTDAIRGTKIQAVFVASRSIDPSLDSSEQIQVFYDLPFGECLKIIEHSVANVILLKDATRGAGHITAVSAMMLGKAHVYTDASVLDDYLLDGRHGISVPIGDASSARQALLQLYNDEALRFRFGVEAKQYAKAFLSHSAFQQRLHNLLFSVINNHRIEIFDPNWIAYLEKISPAHLVGARSTA